MRGRTPRRAAGSTVSRSRRRQTKRRSTAGSTTISGDRHVPTGSAGCSDTEEDTNGDGKPDRWETYDDGRLKAVEFDENGDGVRDRRLTYENSQVVSIETEPDAGGHYTKKVSGPS